MGKGLPQINVGGGKGGLVMLVFVVFIVAIVGAVTTSFWSNKAAPAIASSTGQDWLLETPEAQAQQAAAAGITDDDIKSCNGVQSVKLLYDDKNIFNIATDPASTLMLFSPIAKSVADDATSTTVPIKTAMKGLAAYGSTTYFGQELDVQSGCADVEFQPDLTPVSAPTITVVGDDGRTVLTSSAKETVAAENEYTTTFEVKSPKNYCSAKYGALVACEYDSTYVNSVDSDLEPDGSQIRIGHTTFNNSYVADQWDVFKYPGELCDGARDSFDMYYELSTTTISDVGQADVNCYWLPINKDLHGKTNAVLTGVYDEDNNAIYLVNATARAYTSNT